MLSDRSRPVASAVLPPLEDELLYWDTVVPAQRIDPTAARAVGSCTRVGTPGAAVVRRTSRAVEVPAHWTRRPSTMPRRRGARATSPGSSTSPTPGSSTSWRAARVLWCNAGWTAASPTGWPRCTPRARTPRGATPTGVRYHLGHAAVVVDHFHTVRLANQAIDDVRRRVQSTTLGHRGRRHDQLYRVRRLLLVRCKRLNQRRWERLVAPVQAGDPNRHVDAAWVAKELLRRVYAAQDLPVARRALVRFYTTAQTRSRARAPRHHHQQTGNVESSPPTAAVDGRTAH